MKIVGGPCDGANVAIPPEKNDYVVPELDECVTTVLCSETGRLVPLKIKYTRYTVRTLLREHDGGKYDCLEFLAPEHWSDMDAIRHQFAK